MSEPLRFGLVPVHDDELTEQSIAQLTAALGRQLGTQCVAVTCRAPREIAERFAAGELDVVWSGPTLALTGLGRAVPLVASVRQGVAYYHGVLIVERDSDIRTPMHARGRTVGWVAESSASGYLFARVALASIGLDPTGFFGEERFYGSHGAVARAVIDGEVDVGATFAVFEEGDATRAILHAGFSDEPGAERARVLFCTPPIPSDLVVASKAALDVHGTSLRDALLALPESVPSAIRRVTGAEGFEACRPRFLEQLRCQLEDAKVLGVIDG